MHLRKPSHFKVLKQIALLIVAVLTFTACGSTIEAPTGSGPSSSDSYTPEPRERTAYADCTSIRDQVTGRHVSDNNCSYQHPELHDFLCTFIDGRDYDHVQTCINPETGVVFYLGGD